MSIPNTRALLEALPEQVRPLAEKGAVRSYRKDTVIINEGEQSDSFYILLAGAVRAYSSSLLDERELTYCIDHAGDYFGEMSLDGGPRSASVIALEPTVCAVLTRHTVMQHLGEHAEFANDLLKRVIGRARFATESARRLALMDVYGRMRQLFAELAQPDASGRQVLARMKHHEIASRVGASREMISRVMKDLERGGYVLVGEQVVTLLRPLPERW